MVSTSNNLLQDLLELTRENLNIVENLNNEKLQLYIFSTCINFIFKCL